MIELMKASAGSGKTFSLTKKYISLLLKDRDPHAYRHILAVTFTNKATDEMKSRILKELHILATDPDKSPYLKDFVPSLASSKGDLQKKAENILVNLLHDYSAFAVSTIDKFFQQTLKAFAHEIGQFSSYQVELDKDSLISESVDRVLDSLSEDKPELLSWLKESVMSRLEDGNRYNMDEQLLKIAKGLKSEARRRLVEKYKIDEKETTSRQSLSSTKKALGQSIDSFRTAVVDAAKAVKDAFASIGSDPVADTSRGTIGKAVVKYSSLVKGDAIAAPSSTVMNCASSSAYPSWFRAADRKKFAGYESTLLPPMQTFVDLFTGDSFKVYNTAQTLLGQIHDLGIAAELTHEYEALLKEKNIVCLEDSNTILRDIIDGSDAPFIYEKIGVRFDHFLLDEFQDTSKVQWDNFRPLVEESNSRDEYNLLVGDVKQSIYRWRGSDWDLMAKDVPQQLSGQLSINTLDSNYRSLRNIVEFNNSFFGFAAKKLDEKYPVSGGQIPISDIYSDVEQAVKVKDKKEGSVEVLFTKAGEDHGNYVSRQIQKAKAAGAKYSDIAVLVRTNAMASEIAATLMEDGIPVISDEALLVKSSVTVRRLASLMHHVNSPSDTIGGFLAQSMGMTDVPKGCLSLVDMAESIVRKLHEAEPEVFDGETQYIQAFMDYLQDFVNINGNNLSEFLKSWDDANPSIGSPAGANAVRVMTIHKSKGLEFPYVIVPYAHKTNIYRHGKQWSHPDVKGTSLEGVVKDVYEVELSGQSVGTLFENDFLKEQYLQHIDAINTFYVALTRAGKGLCIISDDQDEGLDNFAQILKFYLEEHPSEFIKSDIQLAPKEETPMSDEEGESSVIEYTSYMKGEMYDFTLVKDEKQSALKWESEYPSFPLNPPVEKLEAANGEEEDEVLSKGRLKVHVSSADFFSEDGSIGMEASSRIKGIVLHDILSEVLSVSDLEKAVKNAVLRGDLSKDQAEQAYSLLQEKIEKVSSRGWFPEDHSKVLNEASVIDVDGSSLRPDRVVFTEDGGVIIVDYKFGGHKKKYLRQIAKYEDLYRKMGYKNVSSYLWYVDEDKILP